MADNRLVMWGTKSNEERVLFAVEYINGEAHTYIFPKETLSKYFVDQMFQSWTEGYYVLFPNPHDHVVHKLSLSNIIPTYARVNRPDIIEKRTKHYYHESLSNKHCDILFTEVNRLKSNVSSLSCYNKNLMETAKRLSQEIKKAEENYKYNRNGKSMPSQCLVFNDSKKLRGIMNEIFEKLNTLREKDQKNYEEECESNYSHLLLRVEGCISESKTSTDWKNSRDRFKGLQNDLKSIRLKKEQRQELYSKMNIAFEKLGKRQTEDKEKYENECRGNYIFLRKSIDSLDYDSKYSKEFKELRNTAKTLKQNVFKSKMNREQRTELLDLLNNIFNRINSRSENHYEAIKQERERKRQEWLDKMRNNIFKTKDSIRNQEESLNRLYDAYRRQQENLRNVRPGRREYEIRSSIETKMKEIDNKCREKQRKIGDMKSRLEEMIRQIN